jgi:DNA-binding SARP family transcriptional activator
VPAARDRLIDELWDGRPPATARKVLQTYVSKLRRLVGEAVLEGGAGMHDDADVLNESRLQEQRHRSRPSTCRRTVPTRRQTR